MMWKVGNKKHIKIGEDSFVVGDDSYKLSGDIISNLKNFGSHYLSNMKNSTVDQNGIYNWFHSEDLGLDRTFADE